MNKVRIFLVTLVLWIIIGFAVYGVVCTAQGNVAIAKMKEAGCTPFAKVGNWTHYHCVDPDGFTYDANDAGMMIPAGN